MNSPAQEAAGDAGGNIRAHYAFGKEVRAEFAHYHRTKNQRDIKHCLRIKIHPKGNYQGGVDMEVPDSAMGGLVQVLRGKLEHYHYRLVRPNVKKDLNIHHNPGQDLPFLVNLNFGQEKKSCPLSASDAWNILMLVASVCRAKYPDVDAKTAMQFLVETNALDKHGQ